MADSTERVDQGGGAEPTQTATQTEGTAQRKAAKMRKQLPEGETPPDAQDAEEHERKGSCDALIAGMCQAELDRRHMEELSQWERDQEEYEEGLAEGTHYWWDPPQEYLYWWEPPGGFGGETGESEEWSDVDRNDGWD